MLFCGERVGDTSAPHALLVDVAVDPLDGTSLVAGGRGGAVAVIAVAERGAMFDPGPVMYMDKLAVGPLVNPHRVNLSWSVARNLASVAEALAKPVSEVTVSVFCLFCFGIFFRKTRFLLFQRWSQKLKKPKKLN